MTFITQQDAFLMFLVTCCALNRLVMAVMRIGLELCCFFLDGITTLVTNHTSRLFRNFTRFDIAVTSFARKIHCLMRPLQRHGISSTSTAHGKGSHTQSDCTGQEKCFRIHGFFEETTKKTTPLMLRSARSGVDIQPERSSKSFRTNVQPSGSIKPFLPS